MGLVVDLIIVVILALSIFLGYKKGLVAVAMKIFAFVIAIIITFLLYKPFANIVINVTGIDEAIENSILENVNKTMSSNQDGEIIKGLKNSATGEIMPGAARNIAVIIVTGGCAIILFLVVRIGLMLITALADAIAKLPILKQFNEVGGVIYGILRGIVIIYAILLIISVFELMNPQNFVSQNIEESYIGKVMYENNIFNVFLK